MVDKSKLLFLLAFSVASLLSFSQSSLSKTNEEKISLLSEITLDAVKVEKFKKYFEFKYSGYPGGFEAWKAANKLLYVQEMWYYTESFYIKRDSLATGITMNEAGIVIGRFESYRQLNTEAVVVLPGYKDVIVLLPEDKLIYKPK